MNRSTVLNLCGEAGAGKTHLLERLHKANANAIQILSGPAIPEPFDMSLVDFDAHASVALDEVLMWERSSVIAAVAQLEKKAMKYGKKLILVTYGRDDLSQAGIELESRPMIVEMYGRQDAVEFIYDGQELRFAKPIAA